MEEECNLLERDVTSPLLTNQPIVDIEKAIYPVLQCVTRTEILGGGHENAFKDLQRVT